MSVQGTDAWLRERLGHVTASRMADLMAKIKSGAAASRTNYMAELIAERLTGEPAARYSNAAMDWGTEQEPQAREAYEFRFDREVVQVGFVKHPIITFSGASPDGLVGSDGLVEIKCPNTATHIDTLLSETVPGKYAQQMLWQMACTGRQWCDFVTFDPRLPPEMRLFVQRVHRDEPRISEIEEEVKTFLRELAEKLVALTTKYDIARAA